jgi:hypothetical protein
MPLITGHPDQKGNLIIPAVDAVPAQPLELIKTTAVTVNTPTVDLKLQPMPGMLSHISGAPWKIRNYYSQVLTKDSELSGLQVSSSTPYQSYTCVKDMVLYVTSPLSTVQDDTTKAMKVEGVGMLLPFIIPNEGDMFTADVNQGQIAVFRITQTTKKSIFQESVYEISYDLDTTDAVKILALEQRTIRTLYYRADYLTFGKNPIITSSEQDALVALGQVYPKLVQWYMAKFFSREYTTLIIPNQASHACDYYLNKFILTLIDGTEAPEILQMRMPNVDGTEMMHAATLWDALLRKDAFIINDAFKRAALIATYSFSGNPLHMSIAFSGIGKIMWPLDPQPTTDTSIGFGLISTGYFNLAPSFSTGVPIDANRFVTTSNLRGVTTPDHIPAVTVDDYYVLSANFWNKTAQMTQFETTVWSYLDGGAVDVEQLLDLSKLYISWGIVEQFYYLPILMLLIKSKLVGL